MTGYWRLPMPRLASLYLPALPIDRIRRSERSPEGKEERRNLSSPRFRGEGDHAQHGGGEPFGSALAISPPPRSARSPSPAKVGEERTPRAPGFRPGARWSWDEEVR